MSSCPFPRRRIRDLTLLLAALLMCSAPRVAKAFCGFFVTKSNATLVSEASSLVVMREGQRTVMTLQPYYRGPIEDFSMILPVPTALRRQQVKTLDPELLERVDTLGAPRLVEYWEQDPCSGVHAHQLETLSGAVVVQEFIVSDDRRRPPAVHVEAKFNVGEYEIVILGARDSLALETWLRANGYQLPVGASEALRPYVETGSRFFVARVNAKKVKFTGERALLSPLRFWYDSPELSIPVRLGLLNADGEQDLVVTVIAHDGRYEAANRPNVAVPTNLELRPEAREHFDEFYAALLDHSFAAAPEAVLTEYVWQASSCDPCPADVRGLSLDELASLGLDVFPHAREVFDSTPEPPVPWGQNLDESMLQRGFDGLESQRVWPAPSDFVITRLHLRVSPDDVHQDDIVLRRAGEISGGREGQGTGAQPSNWINDFQARYAIRHPWTRRVRCEQPVFGIWGRRPAGIEPSPELSPVVPAYLRTDRPLTDFIRGGQLDVELDLDGEIDAREPHEVPPLAGPSLTRCSVRGGERAGDPPLGWAIGVLGLWAWRRRRRDVMT